MRSRPGADSAPDPAGGVYSALPDPLAGFGGMENDEWKRLSREKERKEKDRKDREGNGRVN